MSASQWLCSCEGSIGPGEWDVLLDSLRANFGRLLLETCKNFDRY